MRSGQVALHTDFMSGAGLYGFIWSSTATAFTDSTHAGVYYLAFWAPDLEPSNGPYDRWHGFPVRCLASGA